MTKNKNYQEPEVSVVSLDLEGSVLAGSVLKEGTATGEDVTYGDVFDPWA